MMKIKLAVMASIVFALLSNGKIRAESNESSLAVGGGAAVVGGTGLAWLGGAKKLGHHDRHFYPFESFVVGGADYPNMQHDPNTMLPALEAHFDRMKTRWESHSVNLGTRIWFKEYYSNSYYKYTDTLNREGPRLSLAEPSKDLARKTVDWWQTVSNSRSRSNASDFASQITFTDTVERVERVPNGANALALGLGLASVAVGVGLLAFLLYRNIRNNKAPSSVIPA